MNYLLFDISRSKTNKRCKENKEIVFENKYIKINECCNNTHSKIFTVHFNYDSINNSVFVQNLIDSNKITKKKKHTNTNTKKNTKSIVGKENKKNKIFSDTLKYFNTKYYTILLKRQRKIKMKLYTESIKYMYDNKIFDNSLYVISNEIKTNKIFFNNLCEYIDSSYLYIKEKEYIKEKKKNEANSINLKKIECVNTLYKNDLKNILYYISKKFTKEDIYKLRLIVTFKEFTNQIIEKLEKYIEEFKYVDLQVSYITCDLNLLNKKVDKINKEYGTYIKCIKNKNISEYDILVNFDLSLSEIKSFILKSNTYILNLQNIEEDKYNKYNLLYKKYCSKFLEKLELKRYSITEIGMCIENFFNIDI